MEGTTVRGITKLSERTVKCKKSCGERDFYWAKDNETGRKVLVRASADKDLAAHPDGGVVKHDVTCQDVSYVPVMARPGGKPEGNGKPETNGSDDKPTDERLDALQALLGDLVGNQVDEDEIRKIVDERADERLTKVAEKLDRKVEELRGPTRVTVKNAETGEEREIPDVAHEALPKVLRYIDLGLHVWLVGPAGTGKSHIPEQVCDALGRSFFPQGKVSDPVELIGYMDANGNYVPGSFREPFEHGGVFLLDEADSGHPGALDVLNQALSNGRMRFPDATVPKHDEFVCIVAANTFGTGPDRVYSSRRKLDHAFLDRFWSVEVNYDEALEDTLVAAETTDDAREDVAKLVRFVRHLRGNALEHEMEAVFGMRACIQGARALSAGIDWDDVVKDRVRKGLSDKDWNKARDGWS